MMFGRTEQERAAIQAAVEKIVREALGDASTVLAQVRESVKLRQDIETLKIEKERREEDFARKEREIEHKVGLERQRQEFEISQAKREATVSVREENLKADRERFEGQLKFHEQRFAEEITGLKTILAEVIKRLPSAEFTAELGGKRRGF